MTDDRESWSGFHSLPDEGDNQDSSPARPRTSEPKPLPQARLSSAIAPQEQALDRLERYIDNVVGELRDAAGDKPAAQAERESPETSTPTPQAAQASARPADPHQPPQRPSEPSIIPPPERSATAQRPPASAPAETAPGTPPHQAQRAAPEEPIAAPQPQAVAPQARPESKEAPQPATTAASAPPRPDMRVSEPQGPAKTEMKDTSMPVGKVIDADNGPIKPKEKLPEAKGPNGGDIDSGGGGGGGGGGGVFHKRLGPIDFSASLKTGLNVVKRNLLIVMLFTLASNVLVLAIPLYLFQISDRVLTSRSVDTLVMLTIVIVGAVILQAMFDAIRRFILMRTAVEVAAQLGAPILSAAARAALHSNGREYQTLSDLGQLRSFLVSGTLLSLLDAPLAPLFVLAVFLVHPHLGFIVVTSALLLLVITIINQRSTAASFSEANSFQSKANLHLDSMSRNSQIINALAMIPEAVRIWGKDTAGSLRAQVLAQDRNIAFAATSKAVRLLTQVAMLGWGAHLALDGHLSGGMVIAASIIAGRALGPIEGAIEGWNQVVQSRAAYGRIASLLQSSPLNFERLNLPRPEGRLDVERLLFVPQGTKRVVLNGITFALAPGDSLAIIGNSGAGKTTLGKMLVGSILPTSGNVRLDLMDLRNWDQRQFGENIGYLPQDVQLFPATIKANIARMREDASDADIYQAAMLADVHEMIATLPHGYETFVAADGAPLSGGQKQRIALARAFFGNPRMVVLDEPNSNLDAAGDVALARALQHAKDNKITVITITQRPALLQSVDKILLLVNGTVALFGKRQDVLQALAQRGLSIEGGSFGHQIP
jgi:ATP-binding cassette subfamily C protein